MLRAVLLVHAAFESLVGLIVLFVPSFIFPQVPTIAHKLDSLPEMFGFSLITQVEIQILRLNVEKGLVALFVALYITNHAHQVVFSSAFLLYHLMIVVNNLADVIR